MKAEYLIRFVQAHETFRRPELEALATYESTNLTILEYRGDSPFCIVQLGCPSSESSTSTQAYKQQSIAASPAKSPDAVAASLISRSILSKGIFELWGSGKDYESLHADVRSRTQHLWSSYQTCSFKFSFDTFCGKRSMTEQRQIINSFSYMAFKGKIAMKNPDVEFMIMEDWDEDTATKPHHTDNQIEGASKVSGRAPKRIYLGRLIGLSRRALIDKHDLKKRPYISTTSMDAELALVTATLALAAPNKLFLDPFVGTGGFMVAASELGALSMGSDIDGRSFRGKGAGMDMGVGLNFKKYNLEALYGDCVVSDLTNTPFRVNHVQHSHRGARGTDARWLDGIISDPPYGVREGLKVLGVRNSNIPRTTMLPATATTGSDTNCEVNVCEDLVSSAAPSAATSRSAADNSDEQSTTSPSVPKQTMKPHMINGALAHTLPGYIAPKKPYSFTAMLHDVLDFAANTLVDGGRLAFWVPTANIDSETDSEAGQGDAQNAEHEQNIQQPPIPSHPCLELKHVCTQSFNKWSRRLLVYKRKANTEVESANVDHAPDTGKVQGYTGPGSGSGPGPGPGPGPNGSANDLNPFRRMYFRGFQT